MCDGAEVGLATAAPPRGATPSTSPAPRAQVQLALLDTAGRDGFAPLRRVTLQAAHCAVLCYAVDDEESLRRVETMWIPELRRWNYWAPMLLVGLKRDLREEGAGVEDVSVDVGKRGGRGRGEKRRTVQKHLRTQGRSSKGGIVAEARVDAVLKREDFCEALECSAKSQVGLSEVVDMAVRHGLRATQHTLLRDHMARLVGCSLS